MASQTIKIVGGLAIVSISFGITLTVLNYLSPRWGSSPEDLNSTVIHVTDATYGSNCDGVTGLSGLVVRVKPGNATAAVALACDETKRSCSFGVDVSKIGDPAPGCGKDFRVSWRCGANEDVYHASVSPEATGKTASLTCVGQN